MSVQSKLNQMRCKDFELKSSYSTQKSNSRIKAIWPVCIASASVMILKHKQKPASAELHCSPQLHWIWLIQRYWAWGVVVPLQRAKHTAY